MVSTSSFIILSFIHFSSSIFASTSPFASNFITNRVRQPTPPNPCARVVIRKSKNAYLPTSEEALATTEPLRDASVVAHAAASDEGLPSPKLWQFFAISTTTVDND